MLCLPAEIQGNMPSRILWSTIKNFSLARPVRGSQNFSWSAFGPVRVLRISWSVVRFGSLFQNFAGPRGPTFRTLDLWYHPRKSPRIQSVDSSFSFNSANLTCFVLNVIFDDFKHFFDIFKSVWKMSESELSALCGQLDIIYPICF